jgi:hypothetical protein
MPNGGKVFFAMFATNTQSDHKYKDPQDHNSTPRVSEGNRFISFATPLINCIKSHEGNKYVTFNELPQRALALGGVGSPAIKELSLRFMIDTGRWPKREAQSMLASYLDALCDQVAASPVYLRCAQVNETIYLDMGTESHEVLHITPNGYRILTTSPVVFTRSPVTSPLINPVGVKPSLGALSHFIRLNDEDMAIFLGCLISSWFTSFAQVVMLFKGAAGSGKTTAMSYALSMVDPTTSTPGTGLSNDERIYKVLGSVRWALAFENISYIKGDVSDILARLTTGTEFITRKLFTDTGADITQLRRPVFINGIMDGFSRSDLASRTFTFSFENMSQNQLVSKEELDCQWEQERSTIMAGLCQLTSVVLAKIADGYLINQGLHRNSDVTRVIQIVAEHLGVDVTHSLEESTHQLSESVIDASSLATALRRMVECEKGVACFTCQQLGSLLSKRWFIEDLQSALSQHLLDGLKKEIPSSVKGFGESLLRIKDDLAKVLGVTYEKKRSGGSRTFYTFDIKEVQE